MERILHEFRIALGRVRKRVHKREARLAGGLRCGRDAKVYAFSTVAGVDLSP